MRCIIVSNALPYSFCPIAKKRIVHSGGLVSAIREVEIKMEKIWVGIAPSNNLIKEDKTHKVIRVPQSLYDLYYNGFCNQTLWPFFHNNFSDSTYHISYWRAYKDINSLVANWLVNFIKPNDLIWLHDYHLFLVPSMLKYNNPMLKIGFFLHIPFPDPSTMSKLNHSCEIVDGLLNSDLVGFNSSSYLTNFGNYIDNNNTDGYPLPKSVTMPVEINSNRFQPSLCKNNLTHKQIKKPDKYILGVDRLDPIKGIELKLKAFRVFLENQKNDEEKISLVQVSVPTRTSIPYYHKFKIEILKIIDEINLLFGNDGYVPIIHHYGSVDHDELLHLYKNAKVLWISSKIDGLNLVGKEFVSCQPPENPGVLLLSANAGLSNIFTEHLSIDPFNILESSMKLKVGLEMSLEERIRRHRLNHDKIRYDSSSRWAESFIQTLSEIEVESNT